MKKYFALIIAALLFIGCGSSETNVTNTKKLLVEGESLQSLKLNDQFDKSHTLSADTKKVIFAFSKETGHDVNDFLATQAADFLEKNQAAFVADFSAAPSMVRSMFILPGLKEFKHTVLVIDDEDVSAQYKPLTNAEKIFVVTLDNFVVTDIKVLNGAEDIPSVLE